MQGLLLRGDCLVDISRISIICEAVAKGVAETDQTERLASMAIGSEMDGSFVSRDGPVHINDSTKAFIADQEGASKINQASGLLSVVIWSEMNCFFMSGDGVININTVL